MVEAFHQLSESGVWKATIPQISDALSDLFSGKKLESKEMIDYIKEVYQLIDSINKAPDVVRIQLLLWPSTHEPISYFVNKVKSMWNIDKDNPLSEIFNKYEELFERWWEWCVKQWKEIVSHYHPDRLDQIIN